MRPRLPCHATVLLWKPAWALSDAELERIGRRVWRNECGGTRDGLTSWNAGENFASLGIGHFIWYPKGMRGPFEESFPRLVEFLAKHGAQVPSWLRGECPWQSRAEFQADFRSARMNELRDLLAGTVAQQSRFLAQRMEVPCQKMLNEAPASERDIFGAQFQRLAATPAGDVCLIGDYVNFKGEGTKNTERYAGEVGDCCKCSPEVRGRGPGARQNVATAGRRDPRAPGKELAAARGETRGCRDGRIG